MIISYTLCDLMVCRVDSSFHLGTDSNSFSSDLSLFCRLEFIGWPKHEDVVIFLFYISEETRRALFSLQNVTSLF